jgi:hypothetical protein
MTSRSRFIGRPLRRAIIGLLGPVVLVFVVSFFIDEPFRRVVVTNMNRQLKGYTADIRKLSFHPIGLSLTLYDLRFLQLAHTEPPVFHAPRLDASVEWKALLHGRLVANFVLVQPAVYANLQQLRSEAADPTPVSDHGWQEAFEAIYPLKINEVRVVDGRVTYVDEGPFAPLEISQINVMAQNIRNIRSKDRTYPSDVHADAVVFQNGRMTLDGHADFLATPVPGLQGDVKLDGIPLDYLKPVLHHGSVTIEGGTLAATGAFEYGPTVRIADLKEATISGMKIEYVQTPQTVGLPTKAASKTAQAAQRANNAPDLMLRARRVEIVDSRISFFNTRWTPTYRAFIDLTRLQLENFTNQESEGQMTATLKGRFMGSGPTTATAHFRPEIDGPDFDLRLAIEGTDLRTMNDMLRAHGKFDVAAGVFSFYSELAVKNMQVRGWVKPLFRDVQVYDAAQDRDKSAMRKLYEQVLTGIAKVMKNVPRKEVATQIDVSGRLDNPQTSTVQAIVGLIQNAFIHAILPGFDRDVRGTAAVKYREGD